MSSIKARVMSRECKWKSESKYEHLVKVVSHDYKYEHDLLDAGLKDVPEGSISTKKGRMS